MAAAVSRRVHRGSEDQLTFQLQSSEGCRGCVFFNYNVIVVISVIMTSIITVRVIMIDAVFGNRTSFIAAVLLGSGATCRLKVTSDFDVAGANRRISQG